MKFDEHSNMAILLTGATIIIVAITIASSKYYRAELEYYKIAIQHGCSVNSGGVVCASGDRK